MKKTSIIAKTYYYVMSDKPLPPDVRDFLLAALENERKLQKQLEKLQSAEVRAREKARFDRLDEASVKGQITKKVRSNLPLTQQEKNYVNRKAGSHYREALKKECPGYPHWGVRKFVY